MNADDFWRPWEKEVDSYAEVRDLIHNIFDKWSAAGRVFAWRGQVDASWGLWSSLYRRLVWTNGSAKRPLEEDLQAAEKQVLADFHRWGLHHGRAGRMSVLSQLAVLQHYGAPTRLIDITFNPFIGLWFAVEPRWDGVDILKNETDGRLFAVDVTDRLINEDAVRRNWEDDLTRPWPRPDHGVSYSAWQRDVYAWQAPHFDTRIAAQNGGFLLGGVPITPKSWRYKKGVGSKSAWKIDEVRSATSVSLHPHKVDPAGGGVRSNAVYSVRISANAKVEVRDRLEKLFGYRHRTIYPDYTGFAQHAICYLKSKP